MNFLYYPLPGLMNLIQGLIFFVTARRLAEAGASSLAVAGVMAVWALVYAGGSGIVGMVQNRRNAPALIVAGHFVLLAATAGFLAVSGIYWQYLWMLLTGIGNALFFSPYQAIVEQLGSRSSAAGRSVAQSASIYTFSWSFGFASGPFLCAWIWGSLAPENGWKICYLLTVFLLLAMTAIALSLRKRLSRCAPEAVPERIAEETVSGCPAGKPDFARAGWLIGGVGFFTLAIIRTQIPYRGEVLGFSTGEQAVLLAVVSYVQSFTALSFFCASEWMYRAKPVSVGTVCGFVALLLFALSGSFAVQFGAALLYGVYSGTFCFLLVYHSLANRSKSSHYVAVNEVLVGLTGVTAPLCAGGLADGVGSAGPFAAGALLLPVLMIFQFVMLRR